MKRYIVKNKKLSFMLFISNILCAFGEISIVFVFHFVGDVAGNRRYDSIGYCLLLILFTITYMYFTRMFYQRTLCNYREHSVKQINNDLYQGIFKKSVVEFNQENTSQYISLFNNDVRVIEEQYLLSFYSLFSSLFELTLGLTYALLINVWIGLIMLGIGLLSIFLPKLITRNLSTVNAEAMAQQGHYNSFLKDCFTGFDIIKTTLSSGRFLHQHLLHSKVAEAKRRKMNFKNALAGNITMWIMVSSQLILTLTFGIFVLYGMIDLAMMLALIQLEVVIFYPIAGALNSVTNIKASKDICIKIADLIDTKEIVTNENKIEFTDKISIHDLSFKYPALEHENRYALTQFKYTFEKNKKYAIVGSSGCGKSTLIKLLLMRYRDYQGSITMDGIDYQQLNENDINQIVAVIPQNIFIFNDTLRNNITLYQEASDEEIIECARRSGLTSVIEALPNGLDSMIDENGNNFSGGEKQRIAIARAYLKKNKFIILDEATGSLDNKTAYLVEKAILEDPCLTCISITHRYNEENLQHYDEILVLNEGILEEKGKFDELIAKKSLFYKLYHMNQKEV